MLNEKKEPLWTRSFLKIWLVNFTITIWFFILIAVFPFYVKHLGGTAMTVGLAAGGYSLTCILMRPIAGWFLDNKSRSALLKGGIVGLAVITIMFVVAPVLSFAVIMRLVSGFVFSGVSTASNTNVVDIMPKNRFGEGMAFLGLGNTFASAIGPALGLLLMARCGFTLTFIITAVSLMAAFMAARSLVYKKIERSAGLSARNSFKLSILFNAAALPASALVMCSSATFSAVSIFIALYGEFSGLGSGGLFFMLIALGTGSTRLFSGRLTDKKGEFPNLVAGTSGVLTGFLLLLFTNSTCFYLSALIFGLGFGLINPALQAMAVRIVTPEKRGSASSTYLCAIDIGSGLGGMAAGWLVTVLGYRPMFGAMVIFVVALWLIYTLWVSKTPAAFRNYIRNHS